MKNISNPTAGQKKWRNLQWAKALKTSKKLRGSLHRSDYHCCLGVAECVAQGLSGGEIETSNGGSSFPKDAVRAFFGWPEKNPRLKFRDSWTHAASLNDFDHGKGYRKGLPHVEISEIVKETFCK